MSTEILVGAETCRIASDGHGSARQIEVWPAHQALRASYLLARLELFVCVAFQLDLAIQGRPRHAMTVPSIFDSPTNH